MKTATAVSPKTKPLATVSANGTSLWRETKAKFDIDSFELLGKPTPTEKKFYHASISAYGKNLPWDVYTDQGIEKEIINHIRKFMLKKGWNVRAVSWSEQGLQQDGAWNFDVKVWKMT